VILPQPACGPEAAGLLAPGASGLEAAGGSALAGLEAAGNCTCPSEICWTGVLLGAGPEAAGLDGCGVLGEATGP